MKKKLLIGTITIFVIGIVLHNKPISKIITVESNIYGTPANSAFKDENFYKCVVDAYNSKNKTELDYNVNLDDEQLQSIIELKCSGRNKNDNEKISDISGIEKLVSLQRLDAENNQLTNIDLSKNINLTWLRLDFNRLTSIDLSTNTELETLYLTGNKLETVDLSKNTNLGIARLSFNQLTNIDVSQNTKLIELELNDTQLSSIDLSNNTFLEALRITSDKLTKIDLSKNTVLEQLGIGGKLSNINLNNNTDLISLALNNNELTSIDLSRNAKIESLSLAYSKLTSIDLSKNTALTDLDLGHNKLTNIDVSKNTALTTLNLTNNQLRNIDLSQNAALTRLYLEGNQLTSINLSRNTALTDLDLDHNQLTSIDLSNNKKLTNKSISIQYKRYVVYKNDLSKISEQELINEITNDNLKTKYRVVYSYIDIDGSNADYNFDYYVTWIEATSDKYIINEDSNYIYTGTDIDNETILENIDLTEYDGVTRIIENNKYIVKYNDGVLKEFDLVNISSDKYDLTKNYLYGTYDEIKNNVYVSNGSINLNLITNKVEIKHNDDILEEFDYIGYTSEKYDLSKDYIKVNDDNIESLLSNINCTGCKAYVSNGTNNLTIGNFGDNYKLRIMYDDEIIKEYDLKYAVSGVELNTNNLKLNLDSKKTYKLSANITPTNAENKNVTWTSSNPNVATVDENGLVTAKGLGEATITVKTEDGEYTDTCNVVVSEITTYTVTYKDGNKTYTEEYEEGENITFKSDLDKKGYKLIGFKYNNQDYKFSDNLTMPSSDIELDARWELVIPEIKNYQVNEGDINGIALKTDVNNINLGIDSIYDVKVYNHDGTDKTSGLIATGDKIKIYLDNEFVSEYEVIIKGDVTGTGTSTVSDVAKLYQYLKKKINMDECFIKAGNVVDTDNEIKVNDVAKLYQFIKGKISSL